MKNIRGHKSWSFNEVVEMLGRGSSFTVPTLPHYRYDGIKRIRSNLIKIGFIRKTGKCETSVSYMPTELFKEWHQELKEKKTNLGPVKWVKLLKARQTEGDA